MDDPTRTAVEVIGIDAAIPILGWVILAVLAIGAVWLLEGELSGLLSSAPATDSRTDAGTIVDEAATAPAWGTIGIGGAAALRAYSAGKMTAIDAGKEAAASMPLWLYGLVLVGALLTGTWLVREAMD